MTELTTYQVWCPGQKVPIRASPNPFGDIVGYLTSGDKVTVHPNRSKGYYCLADESVRVINIILIGFKTILIVSIILLGVYQSIYKES